jgi:integrase
MVQGIFRYVPNEEMLAASPARDMNLKLTSNPTFSSYSKKDIVKILTACSKEKVAWNRWLPILTVYTGARRGELVQLRKVDIKID